MEMYCVSCEKNTSNENSGVRKTKKKKKKTRLRLLSNCAVCTKKKSTLYWLERNLCQNHTKKARIVLLANLLNIVQELNNLEKQVIEKKYIESN